MKVLISYGSKSGSAREMATLLSSELARHDVTLADLATDRPDPAAFDYVVLGTSIRMNRSQKCVRRYIAKYKDALCAVPHTLFLCCAFFDQFDHYCTVAFPRDLIETAEECVYFGGDLSLSRQRGMDKVLTRMLRNSILENEDEEGCLLPTLLPEHVRALADRLRKK
jgi:menaquinone-dependent protoporphyrinogen IX oxidase